MSKDSVADWDTTAANNTDIAGIALGEGVMAISSVNDAIRTLMAQIAAAAFVEGTDANFAIADDGDATKIWKVQLSGITTGTTRTWTVPDASSTFVGTDATQVLSNKSFADSTDSTKKMTLVLSGIATATTRNLTVPDKAGTFGLIDAADQTITGGARTTSNAAGTITSGTVTPDPGTRPVWDYTNNGAHTLAPFSTGSGTVQFDVTNGSSAGAITTSGFTKVVGAFDTTSAHKFRCWSSLGAAGSLLTIQAMQ